MFHCIIGGATKGIELLENKVEILSTPEDVIDNIRYATQLVNKSKIYSVKGGENIACKVGWLRNSDHRFHDIWKKVFETFEVHQTKLQLVLEEFARVCFYC